MARISVVIPTSNSRDTLLATLDSVLRQDCRDFEMIISDDGSDDGTGLEVLRRLGPDASRAERVWCDSFRPALGSRSIQMMRDNILIHYLHQTSARGLAATRNRGIAAGNGEMFAFAQPGDIWSERKLGSMVELLDRNADLAACTEAHGQRKMRKPSRKPVTFVRIGLAEVLECPSCPVAGALLRRSSFDCEIPFDENLPVLEEYDFWLRIGSRYPIARLDEPLQTAAAPVAFSDWGLERYRVYALEKAYQGGHLDATMRYAVAVELVRQCEQLVEGYKRRDNLERSNFYERKRKRFAQEVTKLDAGDPLFVRARGSRRSMSQAAPA